MTETPPLLVNGKRLDGRGLEDLRPLRIEAGVLHDADGSALVEWGRNKVVCGIYGPRECIPRHEANPYRALVKCRYIMAPFSSQEEHGRSGPNRRSIELSKVIREVFENLIIAEEFPRTQINIFMEVLQSDGGTRVAAINAASVALVNAGIPMRDMATAVAVGKIDGQMALDLAKEEDNFGQSDIPIALSTARYGARIRKLFVAAQRSQRRLYECTKCGKTKVKRINFARWKCKSCQAQFAANMRKIIFPVSVWNE